MAVTASPDVAQLTGEAQYSASLSLGEFQRMHGDSHSQRLERLAGQEGESVHGYPREDIARLIQEEIEGQYSVSRLREVAREREALLLEGSAPDGAVDNIVARVGARLQTERQLGDDTVPHVTWGNVFAPILQVTVGSGSTFQHPPVSLNSPQGGQNLKMQLVLSCNGKTHQLVPDDPSRWGGSFEFMLPRCTSLHEVLHVSTWCDLEIYVVVGHAEWTVPALSRSRIYAADKVGWGDLICGGFVGDNKLRLRGVGNRTEICVGMVIMTLRLMLPVQFADQPELTLDDLERAELEKRQADDEVLRRAMAEVDRIERVAPVAQSVVQSNESMERRPLPAWVVPLDPNRHICTPEEALVFVSSLPCTRPRGNFISSIGAILARGSLEGEAERSILLCSLLRWFGLDAWVYVGHHSMFVVSRKGPAVEDATTWDPKHRCHYPGAPTEGDVGNQRISFVFSDRGLAVAVGPVDHRSYVDFDQPAVWRWMDNIVAHPSLKFNCCGGSSDESRVTSSTFPDLMGSASRRWAPSGPALWMTPQFAEHASEVESALKERIRLYRSRHDLATTWDTSLCRTLEMHVADLANPRRLGLEDGCSSFDPAMDAVKAASAGGYHQSTDGNFYEVAELSFSYVDTWGAGYLDEILRDPTGARVLGSSAAALGLGLRVKIVALPLGACSVVVCLACRYRQGLVG